MKNSYAYDVMGRRAEKKIRYGISTAMHCPPPTRKVQEPTTTMHPSWINLLLMNRVMQAGTRKKLASYLRNKKKHGETLTPNEARILNQINNYTAESRYGLRMGSYDETKRPSGTQLHHVSQDAAFGGVIPKGEGLTVALHGDAIFGVGSEYYKAHSSLDAFWNASNTPTKVEREVWS